MDRNKIVKYKWNGLKANKKTYILLPVHSIFIVKGESATTS